MTTTTPATVRLVYINDTRKGMSVHAAGCKDVAKAIAEHRAEAPVEFEAANRDEALAWVIDPEMEEMGYETGDVTVFPCAGFTRAGNIKGARKAKATAHEAQRKANAAKAEPARAARQAAKVAAQEETTARAIAVEPPADADELTIAEHTKGIYAVRGVHPGVCPRCGEGYQIWRRGRGYVFSCSDGHVKAYDCFDAARCVTDGGLTWPAYAKAYGTKAATAHALFTKALEG